MPEFQHLCMGCMHEIDANLIVCPRCGYDATTPQYAPYLPKRTVLIGKYLVGKLIRIAADSAIYIGQALEDGAIVTIREFLPERLIRRAPDTEEVQVQIGADALFNNAMGSFESLWRAIMGMENCPALPQVREVFFCNSTVYAVTETLDCITLKSYIESGKRLTWQSACKVFKPVIFALEKLHSLSILHASIDASDLLVGADGKLHIDGFTIPQTKAEIPQLSASPTDGFSALERYDPRIRLGAFSDVYSVAAAMWFCMSGTVPQSAPDRVTDDQLTFLDLPGAQMTPETAKVLAAALQVYPQRRVRTMDHLMKLLYSAAPNGTVPPGPVETGRPQPVVAFPEEDSYDDELPPEDDAQPHGSSPVLLALKVFLTAGVIIALLFCTLYATVLYRYINVPILNNAFSVISFLPINAQPESTVTQAPTTQPAAAQTVKVPDFKSHVYQDILNNKTFNTNFDLEFEFEASETVSKDAIIRQSIPAGTMVEAETKIIIVVSSGVAQVVLKDVVGMEYTAAYTLLTEDGFRVSQTTLQNDGTQPENTVGSMSLVAGLTFKKGTTITLGVWGPAPTTEMQTETPTDAPTTQAAAEDPFSFLSDLTFW